MDTEMKEMFGIIIDKIGDMEKKIGTMDQKIGTMEADLKEVKEQAKKTDLRLENEIVPTLHLVLEQHSTMAKKLEKLDQVENKLDGVAVDVDVIKEVVTQHSGEIETLKKHA